jgi:hypothetical protein
MVRFHTSRLAIIMEALAKDPSFDEEKHMLVGMIEDAIQNAARSEEDVEYAFCY